MPKTMEDRLTKLELAKWHKPEEGLPLSAKAKLFGYLQQEANKHLEHYHSDLFHDALWIGKYVNGHGDYFHYGANDMGTGIGTDDIHLDFRSDLQLSVTVVNVERVWYAMIVDVKGIR